MAWRVLSSAAQPAAPAAGQVPYSDLYVPLAMGRFGGSHPDVRPFPSPTPTVTRTPRPTRTPTLTATAGPSPTPTRPGGPVAYPKDPEAVIIQVGWTDTDQPGHAWEEMNGTPFFTLFGDGRLIAGHALFDWEQPLYEGQVDEDRIQEWLRELTYDIQFFTLEDRYEHPDYTKFVTHVYVRYGRGARDFGRLSIAGFPRWLRDPLPDMDDAERVRQAAEFVKSVEAYATRTLDTPYSPQRFTVLSMEVNPYLPSPPRWTHSLDIRAISDSAPRRYGGGYVHGPPGHLGMDATRGLEIRDIVAVDAQRDWPGLNLAAEYAYGGQRFVVGVRQEIPGESFFLPDEMRAEWYREDNLAGNSYQPVTKGAATSW